MRYIGTLKIYLIVGFAAVAMPIAAHVGRSTLDVVSEPQASPVVLAVNAHPEGGRSAIGKGYARPQDYWDRRREDWEKRLESDLDDSDMDDEDTDKNDKANGEDKNSKAEDDGADSEEDSIERRREYWRQRLDRDW